MSIACERSSECVTLPWRDSARKGQTLPQLSRIASPLLAHGGASPRQHCADRYCGMLRRGTTQDRGDSWTSTNPNPPTQPNTRTLTVGTYRGNNTTYTFSVPQIAFVNGTNTLTILPISGSGFTGFLSAEFPSGLYRQGSPRTLAVPLAPANLVETGENAAVKLNLDSDG